MPKLTNGLYRNPGGRFWLYEFRWKGRRYKGSTGLEARDQAKAWLRAYRDRVAEAEVGLASLAERPTLKGLHALWVAECKDHLSPSTLAIMELRLRLHFAALLEEPAEQITAEKVGLARAAYLAGARDGARRSEGGANRIVHTLRNLLSWGVRRGHLQSLPFQIESLRPQEKVKAVVWPEQVSAFVAVVRKGERHPHASLAVLLQLSLGLRETEALGARWEWVDWRRGVYQVGRAKNRRVREIPIPGPLLAHLQRLHAAQGKPTEGWILPSEDGLPRRAQYTKKPVTRAAQALGIRDLSPHRLRATFATAHFEAGTPLSQIQQMLGHQHPETTMGYIIQRPKDQEEAQAKVAESMGLRRAIPTKSPKKKPTHRKIKQKTA